MLLDGDGGCCGGMDYSIDVLVWWFCGFSGLDVFGLGGSMEDILVVWWCGGVGASLAEQVPWGLHQHHR